MSILSARLTTILLLIGLMSACAGLEFAQADHTVVLPAGTTSVSTPYSPGIRAGNFIYVSGQISPDGGPEIHQQTSAVLAKVKAIVDAAGSSMKNIDKCTVFLTRASDFAGMNEAWHDAFPHDAPARSTVIVALPRPELLIELECIAHV
ncbi:Endoribonuclease L-PSP [Candidatus Burkholderia verschuerenii]|uniref:Endoribonuclease L-PSP n=1 Tax=Candidatus Burkholderia verschuerenii TaxID=242163 RepID=A0A0L0M9X4_9BURK|nr:RidA family protein [Candidatus Burkholderia verschuerenii]KND59065.1 Endoribonuclease L-PSP [Candidatus Burkholderia verschuerenii]